jgi:hypothetical protein
MVGHGLCACFCISSTEDSASALIEDCPVEKDDR